MLMTKTVELLRSMVSGIFDMNILNSKRIIRFTFSGGQNVTLRGSTDAQWGWVNGHGQAWWDAQQQTNRPHGWAFSKIQGGVIRDMKIWKVRMTLSSAMPVREAEQPRKTASCVELRNQWLVKSPYIQQYNYSRLRL